MTSIDAATMVVSKAQKKVFYVRGGNLTLIGEMISKNNIQWAPEVTDEVKTRYALLTE